MAVSRLSTYHFIHPVQKMAQRLSDVKEGQLNPKRSHFEFYMSKLSQITQNTLIVVMHIDRMGKHVAKYP